MLGPYVSAHGKDTLGSPFLTLVSGDVDAGFTCVGSVDRISRKVSINRGYLVFLFVGVFVSFSVPYQQREGAGNHLALVTREGSCMVTRDSSVQTNPSYSSAVIEVWPRGW